MGYADIICQQGKEYCMTTTAIIVHQMEGRMRLRVPDMRGDTEFFQQVSESLEALEDIFSVTTRPTRPTDR